MMKENSQSVAIGYMRDSVVTQINNNYENKEIIDEYLKEKFKEIDELFEENDFDEIEYRIAIIDEKKDKLEEYAELKLLEYKGLIAIFKKDFRRVNLYIGQIKKIQNHESCLDTVVFNLAIHQKDFSVFSEELILRKIDVDTIDEYHLKFFFYTQEFIEGIKFFEDRKQQNFSKDCLSLVAKMYVCQNRFIEGKKILENSSVYDEDDKLWLEIAKYELMANKYEYISEFLENENLEEQIAVFLAIDNSKLSSWEKIYREIYLIRIYILVDASEAKMRLKVLEKKCDDVRVKLLYMDVLEQLNEIEELERVFDEIEISKKEEMNFDFLYRGILVKYNLKKYSEVQRLYETYIEEDFRGDSTYFYGKALMKMYDIASVKSILNEKLNEDNVFSLLLLAELNLQEKDIAKRYLRKITEKITDTNDLNLSISDIYRKLNNDILGAFEVLRKGAKFKESFLERMIRFADETEVESDYNTEIIKIYLEVYLQNTNSLICEYVYNIFLQRKNYRNSYLVAKKMYEIDKTKKIWINRLLESQIAREDYEGINELINQLQESTNAHYLINVATGYYHLSMYELCIECCFRAFYYMDETNKEFILIRIGQLGLQLDQTYGLDFALKLDGDFIITLKANEMHESYCFNKQRRYRFFKESESIYFMGIDDGLYIDLFDKEISQLVEIKGTVFEVIEKSNKYDYMFKKGIEAFFNISHKITISTDENADDISGLIDFLKSQEESQNKCIEFYLKGQMPFSVLCSSYELLPAYINNLCFDDKKSIYAGISSYSWNNEEKIVLSIRSIFILYFNNLLETLVDEYEILVGSKLIKTLKENLTNLCKEISKCTERIGIVNGNPFIDKETRERKEQEIIVYKRILSLLNKVKVVDIVIENSSYISLPEKIFGDVDIESIEIANREKAIVLLEDNMINSFIQQIDSSIKIGTIGDLLVTISLTKNKEIVDSLKIFIKQRYRYVFTLETLVRFILAWKVEVEEDKVKLQEIIELLVEYDIEGIYVGFLNQMLFNIKSDSIIYQFLKTKVTILEDILQKDIRSK